MKNKILISYLLIFLIFTGSCKYPEWDEHYNNYIETVDMSVWDAVKKDPDLETFVEYMESTRMDSIFNKGLSYTLFLPGNEAMMTLTSTDTSGKTIALLQNHISETVFLLRNVEEERALENLSGKFPLITKTNDGYLYDLIPIEFSSPLYRDGVYYKIMQPAIPIPNLYEFSALYSSVIKTYIDLTDSIYLDYELSTPIGFDEAGNTVYDSVTGVTNRFERDFFPVSQEFRNRSATFILFTQDQYEDAMDQMAQNLGPGFSDYSDIPFVWQKEVLLPTLMKGSLFEGRLDYSEFKEAMLSVTGDTVYLDPLNIDPGSRFLCSNGITYTYIDFSVPEDLYLGENRYEGENMVDSIGAGTFAWKEGTSTCGYIVSPVRKYAEEASDGGLVSVSFPRQYEGEWCMEMTIRNVFPRKYRLEWGASFRPSGLYSIYINDEVLTREDRFGKIRTEYDTYELRQSVLSVDGVTRYTPVGNFNVVDFSVENITEFGDVTIRFEYKGTGSATESGFTIDYLALVPVSE